MDFDDLYDENAVIAWDKQLLLSEILGECRWDFSLRTGVLEFTRPGRSTIEVPAQILGSESEGAGTWLWAWANTASQIPAQLVEASLELRMWGEANGVEVLCAPETPLDEVDGHTLSIVASGMLAADGYYRGPHDGGAVFFLIPEGALNRPLPPALPHVATTFTEAIRQLPIRSHRRALLGYLDAYGFETVQEVPMVRATCADGELTAHFDSLGRLAKLESTMHPRRP
ncbi:MAG TPA: hypothetical protein VGK67_30855 [Myxococcales bacterium]|jgi:hypothetical protein